MLFYEIPEWRDATTLCHWKAETIRMTNAAFVGLKKSYNAALSGTTGQLSLEYRNTMKLHTTPTQQYQTITGYETDSVEINAIVYQHSLIVLPEIKPVSWPVNRFAELTEASFEQVLAHQPDVVILGTGAKQQFVHPRLIQALTAKRIGVESMDSQAACRTYNILMAEGRKVALALIMEQA